MFVENLASPDFTLDAGHATITLPGGLSLAPTSDRQDLTVQRLASVRQALRRLRQHAHSILCPCLRNENSRQ